MRGRSIIWLAGAVLVINVWAGGPVSGAEADKKSQETGEIKKAYDSVKHRLVYIEAKRIPKEQPCNATVFAERPAPEKGTGILLTNGYVLTAFHVALKEVDRGQIRCFAIYRETDRIRRVARPITSPGPNDERPQLAQFQDLSILVLAERIDDPSLQTCPSIGRGSLEKGNIVFLSGYKAETIDLLQGRPITDPQTHKLSLLSDCNLPAVCDVGQGMPPGHSGGPVIDRLGNLVGIFKGGDNIESSFEPLSGVLPILEGNRYCGSFLTEDYQKYCLAKVRAEREEKSSFTAEPKRIRCDRLGKADESPSFAEYSAEDGFKIAGFVTHDDEADDNGNGWVGHAEYRLSKDGLHIVGVKVQMGCSGRPTASGQPGWAKTRISGNIKRILGQKDENDIKKACNAR